VGDGIDQDCDGQDLVVSGPGVADLSPGDLVVTEIMRNPAAVSDADGEWFEILNVSGLDVDLLGLELISGGTATVTSSLVVPDGARVVLGASADPLVNGGAPVDFAYGGVITLGNADDSLELGYLGASFDVVAWDGTFPAPTGAAMSLDPASETAAANDVGTAWCDAVTVYGAGDLGTPGAANPACGGGPIDVDGDGYDAIGGTCLGSDCDDGDPNRNPGRVEVPVDGIDQDCDGVDSCYRDLDGDGYGGTTVIDGAGLTCTSSGGLSRTSDDCRDSGGGASLIYPGATDTPGDGIDQNCDGVDQCFRDVDGDGYGSLITTPGPDLSCAGEPGLAAVGGDCQDTGAGAADIRPGATEVCNGVDDDCDTLIDDADPGRTGATTWYRDADGDGFGDAAVTLAVCQAPLGYVLNPSDCRDTGAGAASIYPAAPEIPADGIDQDCDLRDHCYLDQDRDGFGGATAAAGNNMVCGDVAGEADDDDDCADTGPDAASIFPGAPETCNGRDDDCDLLVDDADPSRTGGSSWYPDDDGDGYGDSARGQQRCTQPGGTVADGRDCRDTGAGAASVYPGAPEIPADGADQDCDGKDHCWVDADRDSFGGLTAAAGDNLVRVGRGLQRRRLRVVHRRRSLRRRRPRHAGRRQPGLRRRGRRRQRRLRHHLRLRRHRSDRQPRRHRGRVRRHRPGLRRAGPHRRRRRRGRRPRRLRRRRSGPVPRQPRDRRRRDRSGLRRVGSGDWRRSGAVDAERG
jgi:hypothetical protein